MALKTFSAEIMQIFADNNTDYESMNNLMQDLALGREMYDAENDRVLSKAEAEAKVLDFSRKIFRITDVNNKKEVRRAIRDNSRAWFDIIEDTIDATVTIGFGENGWFDELVDYRNIADGDRQDFEIEKETILAIAKGGVSHHDHIIQRIAPNETVSVPTILYVAKVGADINKYLVGQTNWDKLIQAISKAYIMQIQADVFTQINSAASLVTPSAGFVGTGALSSSTKDTFDEIVQNVSDANDGADVMILGVHTGLNKINALQDGAFAAPEQKDSVMKTGNVGWYEGSKLVLIPNRFKDASLTTKVFNSKLLLILPVIGDAGKFVKVVDEGDTIILEEKERGDHLSDIMTYEVQRKFGVASIVGKQFGVWTLP